MAPHAIDATRPRDAIDATTASDRSTRAQVSPPDVSSCAIIFLVLGDMAAALIGVSFGGEVASLKLGREGKKSVEGSLAMFCVCFLVAMVFFWDVQLSEYAAVVAAATATLTELYEPLLLDDNLTFAMPCLCGAFDTKLCARAPDAVDARPTQDPLLFRAGFASSAVPRALPAVRERARGAVLPLLSSRRHAAHQLVRASRRWFEPSVRFLSN